MKLIKAAAAAAIAVSLATGAHAQSLNVLGHKVHQVASTGETGGDSTAEFVAAHGPINWITADVTPLHDRLFREMTLGTGNVDAAFFLNRFASPKAFELLEPLDDLNAADPIEDFDGLSEGMRGGMTYNGKLYGIPFRHSTTALVYNETLLKEAGYDGPPKTFEELIEIAKKVPHTDANGQKVFGLTQVGVSPEFILALMLSTGKRFLEDDFTLNANTPEYISALRMLKDLSDSGALIDNYVGNNLDGLISDMQNGRAAMSISPFNRELVMNDPKLSRFPGSFKVTSIPPGAGGVPPIQTEVWYLVIPKNSPHKKEAWELIKALSSPEATVREALNGNGAVRPAAYQDPRIVEKIASAAAQARSVAAARLALPGFEDISRAQTIIQEEADAVLLGYQTPEEAAAKTQAQIEPLLPKKQ